jgi:glucose-1-phosphate thymidylyltransferase
MRAATSIKIKKGIVLAGGRGTRLYPLTASINKQLLPVYDKPMIYYPLSTLMLAGIRDILIISGATELPAYERLLGGGVALGVKFRYALQYAPKGIAEAFLIGEEFLDGEGAALILGDNIFWGAIDPVRRALLHETGATIFAYPVKDPQRYGVVTLDKGGMPVGLEEKPKNPKSTLAVTGVYVYDRDVCDIARSLKPSKRGELEITDVNRAYLERSDLRVVPFGRGFAWLDTGTAQSLLEASEFVGVVERRQGFKIGCLEEVAVRMGLVTKAEMRATLEGYPQSEYRTYIEGVLDE